jgi:hypothetical protein
MYKNNIEGMDILKVEGIFPGVHYLTATKNA